MILTPVSKSPVIRDSLIKFKVVEDEEKSVVPQNIQNISIKQSENR